MKKTIFGRIYEQNFPKKGLMLSLLAFFLFNIVNAQPTFDIRFSLNSTDCATRMVCYQVELRSSNSQTWGLAGQNYRLYYNSALASFQSGTSLLNTDYQNFTLVQDVQNTDASIVNGALSFEGDLGFLNYAIDLNDLSNGGISLPADGSWIPTTELCFIVDQSLFDDPIICLEVVWARNGLTNSYATSFVEISEWISSNNTGNSVGLIYDDLDVSDGEASCFETTCAASNYDIQLAFNSLDCDLNTVCYDVQIRGDGWGLAGQNYRLYYDGTLASFQSGSSTLGSAYQDFTLVQDIQNQNGTTPSGNLSFENNLSFLNYTMDLTNPMTGGVSLPAGNAWMTTSQLCFTVDPSLFGDPATCLEAVWARTGLTDEYATSFVEVSEWVSSNNTEEAIGASYNDLTASDGDDACFSNSCAIVQNYDIQLAFNSLDCELNTVCYDVQLRGNGWGLAGQNYRLYYDGTLASFQSGSSTLGSAYQDFTLIQDIQNQNGTTPSGNLSFENNLSFLNYTMDLTNPMTGGVSFPAGNAWMTTSQLCFTVDPSLFGDPATCLEAVWARTGLTDEYATSFVEVSEWVSSNNTEEAVGANYNDLTPSDGDDACFSSSCSCDLSTTTNIQACQDNGTDGDETDDYFTILLNASSNFGGASNQYEIVVGANVDGTGGDVLANSIYGNSVLIQYSDSSNTARFLADGSSVYVITLRDIDDPNCFGNYTTNPQQSCSQCPTKICLPVSVTIKRGGS